MCEGCLLEKHHRNTFPKESMTRANKSLELTHVDVCGVMKLKSHGKSKYFLLFIDDFSRRTWVYFLKEKLEVFEIFKRFKARVENESNLRNQGHENRSRWWIHIRWVQIVLWWKRHLTSVNSAKNTATKWCGGKEESNNLEHGEKHVVDKKRCQGNFGQRS